MMITPTTMPMMCRAEGACRVLFMTSFCFSPFCCFCVENSGLQPCFNGRLVQPFANDDEHILPLRDGGQRFSGGGGVQFQPAGLPARVRRKALHPQHMAAGGIRKQAVCRSLQLLQRQVLFQKAEGRKGFVLVKVQLFAAGLPVSTGRKGGKVGSGELRPVLCQDFLRRKAAGALAAFQRPGQVGRSGGRLGLPGLPYG